MDKKKILGIVIVALLTGFVSLFFPGGFSLLAAVAIGGVIESGILGGFSGKVGPVVGGKWKQTSYMRSHVIPRNPQSTAQQNQRGKMSQIVNVARQIKSTIIDTYWAPFNSAISGFNAFVKYNVGVLADTTFYLTVSNQMSRGSLLNTTLVSAVYDDIANRITCEIVRNGGTGNALSTDKASFVVIDKNGTLYGIDESSTRNIINPEIDLTPNIAAAVTAGTVLIFLFFSRGTGASFLVSDSVALQVTNN